jgi:hypothetical protein
VRLYGVLVAIGRPYLGPATEDWLAEQCSVRLRIEPGDLEPVHLRDLAGWVEQSCRVIMPQRRARALAKQIACAAWPRRPEPPA